MLTNNLNDKKSKKMLSDYSDLKITMAKKHLDKIRHPAQWNLNKKHVLTQIYAEGFFHYSYSAIETIMHDIEDSLRFIPLPTYDLDFVNDKIYKNQKVYPEYTLKDFMTELKNSNNSKANKLYPIFEKYFSKPNKTSGQWDFSKSKLWMLREIRNHLAHTPALSQHANIVVGGPSSVKFAFRFNMRKPKGVKNGLEITISENNAKQFFEDLFKNLIEFRKKIREIVPKTNASSQYKNPPSFGLKF